jgi:hypothetical protein
MRKRYQVIATAVQARINCDKAGNNEEWFYKWEGVIMDETSKLPSGSGINSGVKFDFDASTPEKLVFNFGYHHMNECGMYDGWTDHQLIVTPSLQFGFHIRITGKDRNQIKDYLYETFQYALSEEV